MANCLEFIATNSGDRAKDEIILSCCPQDFYRLKNTPEICGGRPKEATLFMCKKCWAQEAKPIE